MENIFILLLNCRYVNVGSTIANPVFENGELLMHFPSNEKCTATENFASVIDFNCVHSTGVCKD